MDELPDPRRSDRLHALQGGKHFPTDIISGAIIGSLAGWGVPKLHEVDGVNLTIAPSGGAIATGLILRH